MTRAQTILNPNPSKKIILERSLFFNQNDNYKEKIGLNLIYNFYSYFNTNLPNLENRNGLYIPKGYGAGFSPLIYYNNKNLFLSIEPEINSFKDYAIYAPEKKSFFTKLNDIPHDRSMIGKNRIKNIGVKIKIKDTSFGYGNWDQWWGKGIHNSLVHSNNAKSFNYIFFDSHNSVNDKISYKFNFFVSDGMQNIHNENFFLSAYSFILNYKNIEIGRAKHVLSGGYDNILWSKKDALLVPFTNKKNKYWDQIIDYYIALSYPEARLKIFLEIGMPNRSYSNENNSLIFPDHSVASILGVRKYGIFNIDELLLGFEYTSTLISQYYYKMPSYNWYGNSRYNYSSFLGRRWGSHAGTDADDFLVFLGYLNNTTGLLYEINYERHGVSYNFPPEVKLESRISLNYHINNFYFNIIYENEYYEHYGFVDQSTNVWNETFEPGSIQRSNTLLFSIEYTIL
tara:strand:+ start:11516 stop:12880 length:1365 start_codon:yes stop_codon:yes gene_type:complete